MKNVGSGSNILKTSPELKSALESLAQKQPLSAGQVLFQTSDENAGVYLVGKGKVCLRVDGLPRLDRVFPAGSLLGLPATFTASPYSLSAIAVVNSVVLHVTREDFLHLMRQEPVLCQQATDMLSREVSFIQAAINERMHALGGFHAECRPPATKKAQPSRARRTPSVATGGR